MDVPCNVPDQHHLAQWLEHITSANDVLTTSITLSSQKSTSMREMLFSMMAPFTMENR